MANEKSRMVKLKFSEGLLSLISDTSEVGEANEEIEIDYKGEEISIGFNSRYLLDFLSALDAEKVKMELKDGETQGLFGPAGEDEYSYQYVVMPMQL